MLLLPEKSAWNEAAVLYGGHETQPADRPAAQPPRYVGIAGPDESGAWRQTFYPVGEALLDAIGLSRHMDDRYITQASFVGKRRRLALFNDIRCLFVDIDSVKLLGRDPDEQLLAQLLRKVEQLRLPCPSLIVRSGRGFHLKWVLHTPVAALHLMKWRATNAALARLLQDDGADTSVRDPMRVLRMINTRNSRSSGVFEMTTVVHDSGLTLDFDAVSSAAARALVQKVERSAAAPGGAEGEAVSALERHRIRTLLDGANAQVTDIEQLLRIEQRLRPGGAGVHGRFASGADDRSVHGGTAGLNWRRFLDLRTLILLRGGAPSGTRDLYLFWMLNHLALAKIVRPENFRAEAMELSRIFPGYGDGKEFDPLGQGALDTLLARVEFASAQRPGDRSASPLYTPSNNYLLDVFKVSPDEERLLTTIISQRERERRAAITNPLVHGRLERRTARLERAQRLEALAAQEGRASCLAAAAATGVSARHARRLADAAIARAARGAPAPVGPPASSALPHGACRPGAQLTTALASLIERARQLRAMGKTLEFIAKACQRSVRQVIRWLGNSRSPAPPAADGASAIAAASGCDMQDKTSVSKGVEGGLGLAAGPAAIPVGSADSGVFAAMATQTARAGPAGAAQATVLTVNSVVPDAQEELRRLRDRGRLLRERRMAKAMDWIRARAAAAAAAAACGALLCPPVAAQTGSATSTPDLPSIPLTSFES